MTIRSLRICAAVLVCLLLAGGRTCAPAQQAASPAPRQAGQAHAVPAPSPVQTAEFTRAAGAARAILEREEFQQSQPTWWDRKLAQLRGLLARMFLGFDRLTTSAPWLGHLVEWLLFSAAAVGLLLWVLRTVRRQRVRMALGGTLPKAATEWDRETQEWRRVADEEAARGAWRDAIHALYWAAIVHLEQRRAWRHNPSRTPREYVRLLRPGSPEQRDLRGLTSDLEQIWYGQREAQAHEYALARERLDRITSNPIGAASPAAAGSTP